jgi:hypothetical protein
VRESWYGIDCQGPSTTIDNVTDKAKAEGFIVPAGSMFPLISLLDRTRSFSADLNYGAAIPRSTLMHGAYFPPGTMVSTVRVRVEWPRR